MTDVKRLAEIKEENRSLMETIKVLLRERDAIRRSTDNERLAEINEELYSLYWTINSSTREEKTIKKHLQALLPAIRADELIADAKINPNKIYLWTCSPTGIGCPEEKLAAFFGGCIPEQNVYYDVERDTYLTKPKWDFNTGEEMVDGGRLSDIIVAYTNFVKMFGSTFGITDPDMLFEGTIKVDLKFVDLGDDDVNQDDVTDVNRESEVETGRYYMKTMWFTLLPSAKAAKVPLAAFNKLR